MFSKSNLISTLVGAIWAYFGGYLLWDIEHLDYTDHNIDTTYGYYVFKLDSLEDIKRGKEYITNN